MACVGVCGEMKVRHLRGCGMRGGEGGLEMTCVEAGYDPLG